MSNRVQAWVRRAAFAATAGVVILTSGCAAIVPAVVATGFEVYRQGQKTVIETSAAAGKAMIETSAYAARTAANVAREQAAAQANRTVAATAYVPPRPIATVPVPIAQAARQLSAAPNASAAVTPGGPGSLRVVETIPAEPIGEAATAEVDYDQMRMSP